MKAKAISLLILALAVGGLRAETPIAVLARESLRIDNLPTATQELRLTLAVLEGTGWNREALLPVVTQAAHLLAQCDLSIAADLVRIRVPAQYRDYATRPARELARTLVLGKPTVYFVADTRQRPAFDAEAIGRANSRTRPELADTVWLTRATRDPGVALAHELVHLLADSGEHSEEADNLMREDTAPQNVRLSPAQCDRIRAVGMANGLVRAMR